MWIALLWPILSNIILLAVPQLRQKTVWWELALPWPIPLALIPIGFAIGDWAMTVDSERWGGHATKAEYYEDWDEEVPCRHPIYEDELVGYDDEGDPIYEEVLVGYEHDYDVDYHPEHWELKTTLGDRSINEGDYRYFNDLWKNQQFQDLHRDYHLNDGDMYHVHWDSRYETLEPVFVDRWYENRTQAAGSVFKFRDIDPKESPVYEYPSIAGWRSTNVLGPHATPETVKKLSKFNAKHGPVHQCQVWIVTWKNQPQSVGHDQQDYWKGGNKNELIVCVSTDDKNKVQWAYVFSWMDNQEFSYRTRDFVLGQERLDISKLIDYLDAEIPQRWDRKEFSANAVDGGFAYLTVDPPTWLVVVIHIFALLFSGGAVAFVVANGIEEEHDRRCP